MYSTFSRERHSRTIFAPFIIKESPPKRKGHCARVCFPRQWPRFLLKSGRSGGAGYTDPNNNEPDRNKCGREIDGVTEGLVGFRVRHRGLSQARISQKERKCN